MGALDGLRILDFSTLLPGPYATLLLADLGAEVLRICSPDRYDLVTHWPPMLKGGATSAAAAWLGRNKKTMQLNLKNPQAVAVIKQLITEYDIVVEQFRPGVMKKLGLDYATLQSINPRVIYCSLTGYGQTGPLAHRAGHDINYLSRSGNMAQAGRSATGPVLSDMQIADVAAGSMNSVVGILAAVYSRCKTGMGQQIDIAMLDGVIPFSTMDGIGFLADGKAPKREGALLNGGGIYDFYETSDGGYMSVGSLEPKFFAALCRGVGLPDWADRTVLPQELPEMKSALRAKFCSKTQAEWTAIFEPLDACVEPVLSMAQMREDAQIAVRGMLPEVPLPLQPARTVKQLGCPIKLSECPPDYRHAGYPDGYHTREILVSLGYTTQEIERILA